MTTTTTTPRPASKKAPTKPAITGDEFEARTLCLRLRLGQLGIRQRVGKDKVAVDADQSTYQVTKDIVESDELDAIRRHDGEVRTYVFTQAINPTWLRGGYYLQAVAQVDDMDRTLTAMREKREKLIAAFVTAYPRLKEEARVKLRGLYDERDYPTVSMVEAAFTWEQQWLAFGAPTQLKGVNRELFEQERKRMAAMWDSAVRDVTGLLRAQMKDLVDRMVDRLRPDEKGKRKVYRDTLVTNMTEFLNTVDLRNVVDDKALAALTAKARGILKGIDADKLRADESVAAIVVDGFAEIKSALDPMVEDAPSRAIRFAD